MRTEATVGRRTWTADWYIAVVLAAGTAVLSMSRRSIAGRQYGAEIAAWGAMALLTVLVGRLSMRLPLTTCIVSFADALLFLTVLLFGPDLATVTAALDGYAASRRARGTWIKRAFNTTGMALSVNLSSRLFFRVLPEGRVWGGAVGLSALGLVVPMVVLLGAQYLINTSLVAGVVLLKEGVPLVTVWRESFAWAGTAALAGSVAAGMVFLVILEDGIGAFLAILPFPVVLYFAYRASLRGRVPGAGAPSRG